VSSIAAAEARSLQGQRAGFISRFVADAIDLVVVLVALAVIYFGVAATRFLIAPRRFHWPVPGRLLIGVLGWGLLIVYLAVAWSTSGRTLGKQLMGLRVERPDGSGLGAGTAFVRAVICAAIPIGLVWSVVSRERAALHDLIVRTKVVYDWHPRVSG
jgi:uncharacterized RDD family membrane protein YckC